MISEGGFGLVRATPDACGVEGEAVLVPARIDCLEELRPLTAGLDGQIRTVPQAGAYIPVSWQVAGEPKKP
ncbi:hypothetical protein ABZ599_16050 [Streptomyces misionensis]|uniref:hypothetical protein n=1 Tax=Streptomyces misionensis TaxID=67331 RepID=UPI0033F344BE